MPILEQHNIADDLLIISFGNVEHRKYLASLDSKSSNQSTPRESSTIPEPQQFIMLNHISLNSSLDQQSQEVISNHKL